jgi:hypothetical protein
VHAIVVARCIFARMKNFINYRCAAWRWEMWVCPVCCGRRRRRCCCCCLCARLCSERSKTRPRARRHERHPHLLLSPPRPAPRRIACTLQLLLFFFIAMFALHPHEYLEEADPTALHFFKMPVL